ncbi:MAG TPA: efflux RND transporter periplasmic adaptor subunit [Gemmatimonadaceae bacterium]|nr:efflux RND transporter periplasmic adaptor subunit [Gemmatimonadaceae bacterium]
MKRFTYSLFVGVAAVGAGVVACNGKKATTVPIPTAAIERRDIVVDASATGAVEPINVVEVKSKASGQITQMPVETGTMVKPGDLIVQLDTRDVKNQWDQSNADVQAAEAKLQVSDAQKKRSDDLFQSRIITAQEHETAALDFANAKAQLVRARTNLDISQQRLEDATVRAPINGTVIEKTVSLGQVITSGTSSLGGGTTLIKMADLTKVRVRALVTEADIGTIAAGLNATVTVDAYPDRPFRGTVEKIEPQAVVQQSVTMFPVLITISNLEGLLKPGMNGEVSILIDRRDNVLAVPNDAVRNMREAATAAAALGLNPDSVQAQIRSQMASMGGGMGGSRQGGPGGGNGGANGAPAAPAGAAPAGGAPNVSRGEVMLATNDQGGQQPDGRQRGFGGGQMPEVTDKECDAVKAAFAKHPDTEQKLAALRTRVQSGELDFQAMRAESQKVYEAAGVDARIAGACRMRDRQRAGGDSGQRGGRQSANGAQRGNAAAQNDRGFVPERGGGVSTPVQAGEFPSRRARPSLVFVAENGTYVPRIVRLGVGNFDYTEVVSGIKEGEHVALLAAAAMQAKREEQNNRMRNMGGLPGMTGGARPGAGGPGGSGAGAARGGAPGGGQARP